MACSDPLLLQRYFDGDLDPAQAELIASHLNDCDACRSDGRRVAEVRAFVQEQLGAEDEGEEEATARAVADIARHVLPVHTARQDVARWWRRTWMATAALIVMALIVPLFFLSTLDASAAEILEEAAERGRMWMYQPNKVLAWQVDSVSSGIKGVPDGRWRTFFWRSNDSSNITEVSRQINPAGRVEFAYWLHADGSSIAYSGRTGVVEIAPSIADTRKELPSLPPDLQNALSAHLTMRGLNRSLDVNRRRDIERVNGRTVWISGGSATFSRGIFGRLGEVHHIQVVKDNPTPRAARSVHEYDIDTETLRLLRLKTTIHYHDGQTGVHDSRWVSFREISAAEFAAQRPDDILDSGIPVIHLTARDLAKRAIPTN